MARLLSIVSGWTGVLGPFTLSLNGTPLVLTGYTVAIVIRNAANQAITPGGTVTVLNQTTYPGQVTYTPVAGDFTQSASSATLSQAYAVRWRVTDSSGRVEFFANGSADEILVFPE